MSTNVSCDGTQLTAAGKPRAQIGSLRGAADGVKRSLSRQRVGFFGLVAGLFTFLTLVVIGERDAGALPFALTCFIGITALCFVLSRRIVFSLTCSMFAFATSAFLSIAKFKNMAVNGQIIDLYLYFRKPDVLAFLFAEYRVYIVALILFCLCAVAAGIIMFRCEQPAGQPRWHGVFVLSFSALILPITYPAEANTLAYYIRKNHYFSSVFASVGDIARAGADSALKRRLDQIGPVTPFPSDTCRASRKPDVVVVLSESAVVPQRFPEWMGALPGLEAFRSFDGQVHGLRVETYAGGTWISEVQLMAGLSLADLDWRRPYATLFLEGRLQHSLPGRLRDCGYRTVAITPQGFNFVNEGPFLRSIGIEEVLDYKAIGASSKHEPDEVYYKAALDVLRKDGRSDNQPIFLFMLTMTAHGPYDYRHQQDVKMEGEPFGNSPMVDEYLRRLFLARSSFHNFLSDLRRESTDRGVVVAEFGDHQPIVTTPVIEAREGADALLNFASSAYETFYSINTINHTPALALPDYPNLDLSYLGLTILEVAGLPLGPVFSHQKAVREHCRGAFHTCADRQIVDRYLAGLRASNLADLP